MLQLLITGKFYDNSFAPVYVYTMEAQGKFIKRVALMKTLIQSLHEALKPEELQLPPFSPGHIVFVSDNGAILDVVAVASVQPLLEDR